MTDAAACRIVIADDHPVFRAGLRQVVETQPGFRVVGEAADGRAAIAQVEALAPDLLILDANMPGLSGFEVAEQLLGRVRDLKIVILSMLDDEQALNRALNAGVHAYVLKDDAAIELHNCLQRVARGQPYVSPALTTFLLRRRSRTEQLAATARGLEDLTTAERRILKRVAQKKSTKEIARELFLSPRTVEAHRANICQKLSLQGSNSLLVFAVEHRDELSGLD
jgi:DNA-binding NarL/FixJ family response regulator